MGANVGFRSKHRALTIFGDHSYASVGVMPIIGMVMMMMMTTVMMMMVTIVMMPTIVTVICEGRKSGKIVLQRKLHRREGVAWWP